MKEILSYLRAIVNVILLQLHRWRERVPINHFKEIPIYCAVVLRVVVTKCPETIFEEWKGPTLVGTVRPSTRQATCFSKR